MADPQRIKSIFVEACELTGEERERLVKAACGDDEELRREVDELLAAHDAPAGFMPETDALAAAEPLTPRQLGPYRLVSLIGEGGFGSVYLAEQDKPVKRRVALKLIKAGMDTRQVLARFDAERQAMARMDHANIARIYDAGSTPTGRPYFVMELVEGVPITTYCDAHRLSIHDRLRLMVGVCGAVQHAHQKGVIHRDLKPTNVIVTEVDGKATPKVIDFGIAKVLTSPLTDRTMVTEIRQMIGTPQYMSPEQAGTAPMDADTRSDVYGLGVLLYELLTGTTPFDAVELRAAALAEVQRILSEVEPPRPSTRLSTIEVIDTVASNRQVEPTRLGPLLRGELDWVVMKCLEKDRTRRYDSVSQLSTDLERYLSGQTVTAHPPTRLYRLRKFARRNRVSIAVASVVLASLVGGLAVSAYGLVKSRQSLQVANAAVDEAKRARDAAEAARASEAHARTVAEQTTLFVRSMFSRIDPEKARGKVVSVRDVLDPAVESIQDTFQADPSTEASLRHFFGQTYYALGLAEPALAQLQRSEAMMLTLPTDEIGLPTKQLAVAIDVGQTLEALGRTEESEAAYKRGLAGAATHQLGESDIALVGRRKLASIYLNRGDTANAEVELTNLLALREKRDGPDARSILPLLNDLAWIRQLQGRSDEALKMLERCVALSTKRDGVDSPRTMAYQNSLAQALVDVGRTADAVAMQEAVVQNVVRVLGPSHRNTLVVQSAYGRMLTADHRAADALALYEVQIPNAAKALGPEHPTTMLLQAGQIDALLALKRWDDALKAADALLPMIRRVLGAGHYETSAMELRHAEALAGAGKHDEAVAALDQLIPQIDAKRGRELTLRNARALRERLAGVPATMPSTQATTQATTQEIR